MNLIRRLQARNYKSLRDVSVDFGPLTILVGPNGVGKSNIIDCLQFLADATKENLDYAILKRNGMSALRHWSPKGRPFDVQMDVDFDWTRNVRETVRETGPQENRSSLHSLHFSMILGSERRGEYMVKSETLEITGKPKQGIERHGTTLRRGGKEQDLIVPENSLAALRFYSPDSGEFQRFLYNSERYIIFPDLLRDPQRSANDDILLPKAENLAAVLRRMQKRNPQQFAQLENALSAVIPQISDVSVQQVGSFLSVRLAHTKRGDRTPTFDLGMESDGTIRALGLLTALYHQPRPGLLAIEEPELTIHPGAARVIAEVIKEVSERTQVVITTHDPDLLDWFPPETIRVVSMDDGETKVEKVPEGKIEQIRQELTTPGELLRLGLLGSTLQQVIAFEG